MKDEFSELSEVPMEKPKRQLSLKDMQNDLENEIFPANKMEQLILLPEDIESIVPSYQWTSEFSNKRQKFAVFNIHTKKIFISMSLQKAKEFLNIILQDNVKEMLLNYRQPRYDNDFSAGWNWEIVYQKPKK